jgi:hypothetical protein
MRRPRCIIAPGGYPVVSKFVHMAFVSSYQNGIVLPGVKGNGILVLI